MVICPFYREVMRLNNSDKVFPRSPCRRLDISRLPIRDIGPSSPCPGPPFDLRRSGGALDVSHLINFPLLYFNESFPPIFILKISPVGLFSPTARLISQTVTFHSAPSERPSGLLLHIFMRPLVSSCFSSCVFVSASLFASFFSPGAGTAAGEAAPSVPAP